jgi:hypothetical protein
MIAAGKVSASASGTTTSSGPNAQNQAWIRQIMSAAQGAGSSGPSPLVTGAADTYNNQQAAGKVGTSALSGDPTAVNQLMNPYMTQVIGANNAQWQNTNAQDINASNANATAAGAFGGSRAAIQNGAVLSANNLAQNTQTAGLLSQGYTDAMGQASTLANMGSNAAGANATLGMGGVGSAQQWLLQMLKQGYNGLPVGTTGQTNTASGDGSVYFGG